MMRSHTPRKLAWAVAATVLWTAAPAAGEDALSIPVQRSTLGNGLRIVLSPDTSAPVVAVAVYYDVGSRNEVRGRSGFAHLFEHMMFEGSANVGKNEHTRLINAAGGSDNGSTSSDRTNYYEGLPSNQLALGLWLEADRMRALAITDENFENQRSVVINEYHQSYENRPYGLAGIRINALSFGDYFPYANPTIGSVQDLESGTLEDARSFWESWYGPNNAVLVIVGDFDPAEALRLAEEHFGDIPSRPRPDWVDPGFPGQSEERTEVMYDRLAPLPAFYMTYHIPPMRHPDHYALEMLGIIMGYGESSRIYRSLVEEQQVCTYAYAYTDGRRGPDLINFEGYLATGHQPDEARRLVDQEIERVRADLVTERELTRARNRVRSYFISQLQTAMDRAQELAEFELYYGDARLMLTEMERYLAVTREQVREVANRYLITTGRSVLDVLPGEPPTDGGRP